MALLRQCSLLRMERRKERCGRGNDTEAPLQIVQHIQHLSRTGGACIRAGLASQYMLVCVLASEHHCCACAQQFS
jgi:hypothetical protein